MICCHSHFLCVHPSQSHRYGGISTFFSSVCMYCEDLSTLMHEKMGEIKIKWNWSECNRKKSYFLKRMSLHKMIRSRCASSCMCVSVCVFSWSRHHLVAILRASGHVIWILCDLITAYNKLHIHAMPRIYYKRGYVYFFAEALLLFVLRNRLIISRELSFKTDNLY